MHKQEAERAGLLLQLEDAHASCAEAWALAREASGGAAPAEPGGGSSEAGCGHAAGLAAGTDAVSVAVDGTAE